MAFAVITSLFDNWGTTFESSGFISSGKLSIIELMLSCMLLTYASKRGFVAVEHAISVLLDAPRIQRIAHNAELITLIRSPLAMESCRISKISP